MTEDKYYVGLLKGWLLAKDAPREVVDAVDRLGTGDQISGEPTPIIRRIDLELPPPVVTPSESADPFKPPRKKPIWSEEQRRAAGERLRKAREAKAAARETIPAGESLASSMGSGDAQH